MKEKYRLQVLLTVRARVKKRAEIELAKRLKELVEEKKLLEKLEQELKDILARYDEARREMKASMHSGGTISKGNVHVNFLRRIKEDEEEKRKAISLQEEAVKRAEHNIVVARREYIEAAKQLQMMEKHKELWVKRIRGELSQLEAKKLNELGNAIHSLKRWRGEKSLFEV